MFSSHKGLQRCAAVIERVVIARPSATDSITFVLNSYREKQILLYVCIDYVDLFERFCGKHISTTDCEKPIVQRRHFKIYSRALAFILRLIKASIWWMRAIRHCTFFLHACSKALLQPTISTLISFIFVYKTVAIEPTCILMILANTSSEEALKRDHPSSIEKKRYNKHFKSIYNWLILFLLLSHDTSLFQSKQRKTKQCLLCNHHNYRLHSACR